MRQSTRTFLGVAAATLLTVSTIAVATQAGATGKTTLSSNEALGLSDSGKQLRIFELNDPDDQNFVGTISGFEGDDTELIGIDYRKASNIIGAFYGVGDGGVDGTGAGVYTINTKTAELTKVSELTVALDGHDFGVDFNPAADRLRIVSDFRQNLRHDIVGGSTIEDGQLAVAGSPNAEFSITGVAYTNNDLSPDTGTTLFDFDTATVGSVLLQQPPNDGVLTFLGTSGFTSEISPKAGFDIQSKASGSRAASNTGYASLRSDSVDARPNLYKVDLLSGKVTKVGDLDGHRIADIAVMQPW